MKIQVSNETYSELSLILKRLGRDINDGSPLTIEKGDAIFPPQDFRMVAIRQNCLMAAVEIFKNAALEDEIQFLNIADKIFNWCLSGEIVDKEGKES
jgi:hypothetical protein